MFHTKKKKQIWPYVFLAALMGAIIGAILFAYLWVKNLSVEKIISNPIVQKEIAEVVGEENRPIIELFPSLLGFSEPQNYLLLFLNNTEIRPGGGFIGSYATVNVNAGEVDVLVLEGSEAIDRRTPESWRPTPPQILTDKLGVDRWYFRDSNWSPDFTASSQKTLQFYKAEGGTHADEIDAVIGITPTVLEGVLEIIGPIDVEGIHFTAGNVIEKLEYEVEYGYETRGIPFAERKKIIGAFMDTLLEKTAGMVFSRPESFLALAEQMLAEKHVMIYANDPKLSEIAFAKHWDGRVNEMKLGKDYLLWVDANLAALKTDHAMSRYLAYTIRPEAKGNLVGTASMRYVHTGKFDWRTSRYRTFARIYTPPGSTIRRVYATDRQGNREEISLDAVEEGNDLGYRWFGTFFVIEPGNERTLSFEYNLDGDVAQSVAFGNYELAVQKQLGTIEHGLTLSLDFGKNVTAATPPEAQKYWGDTKYELQTTLKTDKQFKVGL